MLERGETQDGEYGERADERERLASANAERNIVRLLGILTSRHGMKPGAKMRPALRPALYFGQTAYIACTLHRQVSCKHTHMCNLLIPLAIIVRPQERLRQQIEEIKEAEATYDPNAALAMAMFEHTEVCRNCPNRDEETLTAPRHCRQTS